MQLSGPNMTQFFGCLCIDRSIAVHEVGFMQNSTDASVGAYLGQHLIQAEGVRLCRIVLKLHRAAAAVLRAVVHALEALHSHSTTQPHHQTQRHSNPSEALLF